MHHETPKRAPGCAVRTRLVALVVAIFNWHLVCVVVRVIAMALIYVTGIETAGKTTVCQGLKSRGFEAYDIDEGIAHYYDKVSKEQSEWLDSAQLRTQEWHSQNDYMMDRAHVERLKAKSVETSIYLCGTTQHDENVRDLFDQIFYLYLDEETLRRRMVDRRKTPFAYSPEEEAAVLSWHQSSEQTYRQLGVTMIDATRTPEQVLEDVLRGSTRP